VLISSHLISEVAQTADRLVVIGQGRLLAQTTVAELSARSNSLEEAFFTLTEGSTDDALQSFCRRLLPQHWAPRHYVHVDHIPLTATGKPARAVAAAMARQLCGH
jgi:acyl-CoA synthetase (AMP-forming)/AMP-acid ligase II